MAFRIYVHKVDCFIVLHVYLKGKSEAQLSSNTHTHTEHN